MVLSAANNNYYEMLFTRSLNRSDTLCVKLKAFKSSTGKYFTAGQVE